MSRTPAPLNERPDSRLLDDREDEYSSSDDEFANSSERMHGDRSPTRSATERSGSGRHATKASASSKPAAKRSSKKKVDVEGDVSVSVDAANDERERMRREVESAVSMPPEHVAMHASDMVGGSGAGVHGGADGGADSGQVEVTCADCARLSPAVMLHWLFGWWPLVADMPLFAASHVGAVGWISFSQAGNIGVLSFGQLSMGIVCIAQGGAAALAGGFQVGFAGMFSVGQLVLSGVGLAGQVMVVVWGAGPSMFDTMDVNSKHIWILGAFLQLCCLLGAVIATVSYEGGQGAVSPDQMPRKKRHRVGLLRMFCCFYLLSVLFNIGIGVRVSTGAMDLWEVQY